QSLIIYLCYTYSMYLALAPLAIYSLFFFNNTATSEIYTLSLHDALPICLSAGSLNFQGATYQPPEKSGAGTQNIFVGFFEDVLRDRKSTRLNSSHVKISYAVFCLKKKKKKNIHIILQTALLALKNIKRHM